MAEIPEWVQLEIERVREQGLTILDLNLRWHDERESLTHIPDEVCRLKQLEVLNLRGHSKITEYPAGLRNLTRLKDLKLDGEIEVLPDFFGSLTSLRHLEIIGSGPFGPKVGSSSSTWASGAYTKIPNSLKHLRALKSLVLRGNYENIPNWIGNLAGLRRLDLIGDYDEIPTTLASLRFLTNLTLYGTYTEIPYWIFDLGHLKQLSLSGEYRLVSEALGEVKHLQYLDLYGGFRFLPSNLSKLVQLSSLTLNGELEIIPEWIFEFEKLKRLDLAYNQIKKIPASILQLRNLEFLILDRNPIETPPREVIGIERNELMHSVNLKALRSYFEGLQNEKEDFLYEAKLLILGEGGAGKTSLARKIIDPSYQLAPQEKSTEGIAVMQWEFPFTDRHSFRVNIWDFGGQEIYHATHQFFLTSRSLYALVTDTRKEDTDFNYWLNVVQLLGGDSPVLIVKNEKQDRQRQIGEPQLKSRFPSITGVLPTNLESNRNLDRVQQEIMHQLRQLPHIGTPLPRSWVAVREMLEHDNRNYITLDEYYNLCVNCNLSDQEKKDLVIGYLHDLGVCLHFKNDPLLKRFVILKPHWATSAVYTVLDNKAVISNFGRFSRKQLDNIWIDPSYEGMHDELLRLMMRFKLCYEIPTLPDSYIAPQLLSENQPSYEWDSSDNRYIRYVYGFMPKGMVTRLIVAMNRQISGNHVWKTGVILSRFGATAEVIEHYSNSQIHIRIAGKDKKALLAIIMHELEEIHSTYSNLQVDALIPCNCSTCSSSTNPYFFRYEVLQNSLGKTNMIQCQESFESVDTRRLLDDALPQTSDRRQAEIHDKGIFIERVDTFVQTTDLIRTQKQEIYGGEANMSDNQTKAENEFHGNIQAGNLNIGGEQKFGDNAHIEINISALQDAPQGSPRAELRQLLLQLQTALKSLPPEQAEDVELIREYAETAVEEASKESPNPKKLRITGESLKSAAQNLLAVAPIAVQIAAVLTGIAR